MLDVKTSHRLELRKSGLLSPSHDQAARAVFGETIPPGSFPPGPYQLCLYRYNPASGCFSAHDTIDTGQGYQPVDGSPEFCTLKLVSICASLTCMETISPRLLNQRPRSNKDSTLGVYIIASAASIMSGRGEGGGGTIPSPLLSSLSPGLPLSSAFSTVSSSVLDSGASLK